SAGDRGEAGEAVEQRGLAGSVGADEADHLAGPDLDLDSIVGHQARVALGDLDALEVAAADGRHWRSVSAPRTRSRTMLPGTALPTRRTRTWALPLVSTAASGTNEP